MPVHYLATVLRVRVQGRIQDVFQIGYRFWAHKKIKNLGVRSPGPTGELTAPSDPQLFSDVPKYFLYSPLGSLMYHNCKNWIIFIYWDHHNCSLIEVGPSKTNKSKIQFVIQNYNESKMMKYSVLLCFLFLLKSVCWIELLKRLWPSVGMVSDNENGTHHYLHPIWLTIAQPTHQE